ncbi:MAG: hypothetical protein NTY38_29495 [Acidobacteria bacterium]|nr:hypothetical protein [Acidobacteriota bacterium]
MKPVSVGSWIRISATKAQVEQAADRHLRAHGVNPAQWMRVSQFLTNLNGHDYEYLRQVAGAPEAQRTVRQRTASGLWLVRYFQPQRKEEWQVILTAGGTVYRLDHELDEKAPGQRLTAEQALAVAQRVLAARGTPLADYRLVDSQQEQKDNRTDHAFTWEDVRFGIGEARARVALRLNGDEPSGFRRYLKLPEEWLRDFTRPRLQSFLLPGLLGAIGLPTLIVFLRRLSGHHAPGGQPHRYHWRAYLMVAGAGLTLAVVSAWNNSALAFTGYDTATPLQNFIAQLWISRLLSILFATLLSLAAAMVVDVFWQMKFRDAGFRRPSIQTAFILTILLAGGSRLLMAIGQWIPGPKVSAPMWQAPAADAILPAISVLQQSFVATLAALTLLGVAVLGEMRYLSVRGQRIFLAVVCLVVAATSAQTPLQFVADALLTAVALAAIVLVFRTYGGDLISYTVAFFWAQAASRSVVLLMQPAWTLPWNGGAAALLAILAGVWLIRRRQLRVG